MALRRDLTQLWGQKEQRLRGEVSLLCLWLGLGNKFGGGGQSKNQKDVKGHITQKGRPHMYRVPCRAQDWEHRLWGLTKRCLSPGSSSYKPYDLDTDLCLSEPRFSHL